jgi:hypothetical protein
MTSAAKDLLISAIITQLAENNKKRNAALCKKNLHAEQKAFDHGEMFISLAFMEEGELSKIAALMFGGH